MMLKEILEELKRHAPFTAFGAVTGIAIMVLTILLKVRPEISNKIYYTLHPVHVLLSALVTVAMFRLHTRGKFLLAVLIGWTGSVGIATLSDSIIPHLGGTLLGITKGFHVGFIEKWWLVNPLALLGIIIGYLRPTTRFPHAGHVLLSTWASLFYFIAFKKMEASVHLIPFIFLFLFLAVWVPCCVSDIVFPLLFVRKDKE